MRYILLGIIFILIFTNLFFVVKGRRYASKISEGTEASEEEYNKGMRYFITAAILSFITIITISVVAILYVK